MHQTTGGRAARLPYLRGLDGLRALSVVGVLLYHAGVSWLPGGFLGVDVFFVLSGYLITSLLLVEWQRTGRVSISRFYLRRARRLLPAVFAMLVAVAAYAVLFVPDEVVQLRRDTLAALVYGTNWYLVVSHQSYFQALGRPSLLRHLWSLAVEEQFYLTWPLLFSFGLRRCSGRRDRLLGGIVAGIVASTALMWLLFTPYGDPSRVYYGTDTRAATLLVGVGLALLRRPRLRRGVARQPLVTAVLDVVGVVGLLILVWAALTTTEYADGYYRGGALLVALAAATVIAAIRQPGTYLGLVLGLEPLRWLGVRSYAIYLWHWPVFMLTRPRVDIPLTGVWLLALRFSITVGLATLSYRFIEAPIRAGALSRGWQAIRRARRERRRVVLAGTGTVGTVLTLAAGVLTTAMVLAGPAPAIPGGPVSGAARPADGPAAQPADTARTAAAGYAEPPPVSVRIATFKAPVRVSIFGDSQGRTLILNAPAGLSRTLALTDATVEGCGVVLGKMSSGRGYRRDLDSDCGNWPGLWRARAAAVRPQIALVMIGAWEVFDLVVDGHRLHFDTPAWDEYFTRQLGRGVDILRAAGAQVALMELPCYRPVDGGGLIALPERGQDWRTRHVNTLLAAATRRDPLHVVAITPPRQFCTDPSIARNLAYRWDGVHYYIPGARLVFDVISPQLLAVPRG